jgi:predicted permease
MGRLLDVPLGLEPEGLLTMQVQATGQRYADDASADRFFAEVLAAVRRVPGVGAAAFTSQLPLSGDLDLYGARLDPPLEVDPGEERGTFRYAVSPGYLDLMGIPLRRGRALDAGDRSSAALVAVISESFARRRLPGQDPIGHRLRLGDQGPFTIVGVVGDVRQESLAMDHADAVYLTVDQWANPESAMSLVVRGGAGAGVPAAAVRQAVWSVDPGQPVVRQAEMTALVSASAAERRFVLVIFQAFALAALVLAATGLYGVLAGMVAERTREIGVRAALGASRRQILALVLGQGMAMAGVGVVLGLAGALAATTAIGTMLFGITALDPLTWALVTGLLGVVALVACLVPAWRAVRVPPSSPLRADEAGAGGPGGRRAGGPGGQRAGGPEGRRAGGPEGQRARGPGGRAAGRQDVRRNALLPSPFSLPLLTSYGSRLSRSLLTAHRLPPRRRHPCLPHRRLPRPLPRLVQPDQRVPDIAHDLGVLAPRCRQRLRTPQQVRFRIAVPTREQQVLPEHLFT